MLSDDQFHTSELERVLGPNRVQHPRYGSAGGEWDSLRSLDRTTQRSLTGAGFLHKEGLKPDVAADIIMQGTRAQNTDEAMEWYAKTATGAIQERRRAAGRNRAQRWAEREGYKTPYQRRNFNAVMEGHENYTAMRKAKGY